MLVVTGASEVIGSAFIKKLIEEEYGDIIAVDSLADAINPAEKKISERLHPEDLSEWIKVNQLHIQFVFHLSEKTDLYDLKSLWNYCAEFGLPFVAASRESGAFDHFKLWSEEQERQPYFWAGLQIKDVTTADAAEVIYFLMHHRKDSGIYNPKEDLEKLREVGFYKDIG